MPLILFTTFLPSAFCESVRLKAGTIAVSRERARIPGGSSNSILNLFNGVNHGHYTFDRGRAT
jgi:hypothetical protein